MRTINERQQPWENTSLVRDFYFKGAPAGEGYRSASNDSETESWANVAKSRNIYDFIGFLRRYPESRYRADVANRINEVLARIKPAPPAIQLDELPTLLSEFQSGARMRPLNKYSAEYFGLPTPDGLLVMDVSRGSFADRAGILPGDILLSANGNRIRGVEDAIKIGRSIIPGEFIEGTVWRNRREVALSGMAERAPLDRLLEKIAFDHFLRKEYERANVFYQYLASTDDAQGQLELGTMYMAGLGVPRDYKLAESWLLKAALQGKPFAAYFLSAIYLNPNSGVKNDPEAFRWAKYSADAGVPEGEAMLAAAYIRGVGTAKDQVEGTRWARLAAEQGQSAGMFLLGAMYENGAGGVPRSVDDAKGWYRRARDLGFEPAKAALKRLGE